MRLRIWCREATRILVPLSWLAATLCLVAGLWHVAVEGLPRSVTLVLPGGLLVLALARALVGRPSLERAARTADRWLDGRGLVIAAADQLERPPKERAAAAGLVLERAGTAAAQWHRRLRESAPPTGLRRAYPPLAILAVAGVLSLFPGAAATSTGRAALARGEAPSVRRLVPEPSSKDLGSDDSTTRRAEAPAPDLWSQARPVDTAAPPGAAEFRADAMKAGSLRAHESAVIAGNAPGDAAARSTSERPEAASTSLPVDRFALQRNPGARGRSQGTPDPANGVPTEARASGSVSATRLGEGPRRPDLTPQLRSYVDAILRARGGES